MQRGLIHHRAGQKRLAVVFQSDGHVSEPLRPMTIQMALDPDLIDHRLIEIVCHHPVPFVAVVRCTRSIATTRYLRPDTKVWFGGIVMNRLRALPDPNLRANGRPGYSRPSSRARATASVRLRTWSLRKMFRLCPLTVIRARKRRSLISRFESPWAMSCSTSNSRWLIGSIRDWAGRAWGR